MDDSPASRFFVKSMSVPHKVYKVDVVVYSCSCPDFPSIRFCKHIFAVQRYFPSSDDETCAELESITADLDPPTSPAPEVPSPTPSFPLDNQRIIQKLETLAACMRHTTATGLPTLNDGDVFENFIDEKLDLFQNGSVLVPKPKKLAPHLNSWPETQAVMMPASKTRKKRVGDAYGGGEHSGKKAKKESQPLPKPTNVMCVRSSRTDLIYSFLSLVQLHQP